MTFRQETCEDRLEDTVVIELVAEPRWGLEERHGAKHGPDVAP